MKLTLKIWRQKNTNDKGKMVDYQISDVSPDMSFLEMLDVLNEDLIVKDEEPVAFDHDCREGICGMCSLHITENHTVQIKELLLVNCTCVALKMGIQFILSHLERKHFQLL